MKSQCTPGAQLTIHCLFDQTALDRMEAWDGAAAGASQREIAAVLFGSALMAGTEGDNRYFDSIRKRVARLIDLAEQRIAIGARRFLGR